MRLQAKEILNNLKEDLNAAKIQRKQQDEKIARWKREYNGELYGNENDKRSKIVSRDIKKHSEWQHASLVEPFVSTPDIVKANPVTYEDAEIAPKIEVLLNTQFCRQFPRYSFMNKAIRLLDQEGTCVVRLGWEYKEDIIEERIMEEKPNPEFAQAMQMYQQLQALGRLDEAEELGMQIQQIPQTIEVPKVIESKKAIKDNPTAMLCRNEDVFIDPTCMDDIDKAQFIIYRYETDMTTLRKAGIYKNLENIKLDDEDDDYISADDTHFRFKDKPRKKLVVHEYWGNYDVDGDGIAEPIVCTWVNDVIIQLKDNPFPDKKPPFIVVPFNCIPFTLYGESNAELISDIQRVKTSIYRGFIDNMALSNNGQKGIRQGSLDNVNRKRFLSGENFEFIGSPSMDFYDGHFNELPGSIFNVLQLMNNEAESVTGIPSFNTGINGNALGGTATQVRGAIDSASTRRLNIVRNISENLVKPLLRKWLVYSTEFLSEETQIRITNEEFIWLKRDDLGANIDIDLNISTSDDNQAKASELAFMLQTIGPHEDPNVRKILMMEIARLYRMPELVKKLEMYEPQPDPMAQRIQELQAALLESEIAYNQSRAKENEMDYELKGAKTETEMAKAKHLGSQADKLDLDYLHDFYGIKDKRRAREQQAKNQFELDKQTLKALELSKRNYL